MREGVSGLDSYKGWSWIILQAMVHELLGIQDNRVDLTKLPKVPKDLQVFTLHYHQSNHYSESY